MTQAFRHHSPRRRHRMSTGLLALAAGLTALVLAVQPAGAQSRPSIVVSPDLNAPWVLSIPEARVPAAQPRNGRLRRPSSAAAPRLSRPQRQTAQPEVRRVGVPTPSRSAVRNGFPDRYLPRVVDYRTSLAPGTIYIDTVERYLFLVLPGGKARRYGVGVGKPGFEWAGTHRITRKSEWPSWTPPKQMIARVKREEGRDLPSFMPGGPKNPMGARGLYLGSTLYRIHGTNQPWSIGQAVSSGCIRMRNIDVVDLYDRVPVGTKVVVR